MPLFLFWDVVLGWRQQLFASIIQDWVFRFFIYFAKVFRVLAYITYLSLIENLSSVFTNDGMGGVPHAP